MNFLHFKWNGETGRCQEYWIVITLSIYNSILNKLWDKEYKGQGCWYIRPKCSTLNSHLLSNIKCPRNCYISNDTNDPIIIIRFVNFLNCAGNSMTSTCGSLQNLQNNIWKSYSNYVINNISSKSPTHR